MSLEILFGLGIISGFAIWGGIYIYRRTRENNNEHLFEFIPHLFPTLGILFTFLGIAIGLWNFDSNDIEKSIPELMNGLKTAFIVSIFGVFLLVIFSFITSVKKKKLEAGLLSDETNAILKLTEIVNGLRNDLSSTNDTGQTIKPGNLLRDIYQENSKQSNALQTFSTDLAITISAGFEQILNNPHEGVVAELRSVKNELEALGNKLQDPATDMTQSIVSELQESISKMVEEFKNSMSGNTKNELDRLANLLEQAGGSLNDFPAKLQAMTENLNENFNELQEMSRQVSEQTFSQSEQCTIEMRRQVEEMSEILKNRISDLQVGQQMLLTQQSENLNVSVQMLQEFNTSITNMNGISTSINQTMSELNTAHNDLENVISSIMTITNDMTESSSKFGESQVTFSKYSNEFLRNNTDTILEFQNSLHIAKDVSSDYAQKFEIIENGLKVIFAEINTGLNSYQTTIKESLETFLAKYTEHLTQTAESLAAASGKQEDILEELTEQLSNLNGFKK